MRTLKTLLVIVMLFGLAGNVLAQGGEELTIGALWLDASEFYTGVAAGIEMGAAESEYTINLLGNNSQGDAAIEAEQMQTLIGADVDAIIMSAVSDTSSVALIAEAYAAGIPVICYNTCIALEDAEEYVYAWVTGDHFQQGGGVGKALGEYFVAEGVEAPEIGVISCERYGACQERIAGFTEELLKLVPGAVIVDNQEALEVDLAVEVATNMLTAHPTLDAFYGEAGNMVAGAAVAIELAGRDDVVVFGHDISPTTAELLLDGSVVKYINAMIAEDFGMTALDLAIAAINGEPSPGVIYNMTPMDFFSDKPEEVEAWVAMQEGGAAPVADIDELTVGALWLDASEFYTGVAAGIEMGAAEQSFPVNVLGNNSQGDAAIEAEQMQTLIGANVDAIIMSAVSDTSSVALIAEAYAAGIPVICYNTCIALEDAEEYVYAWVTGDHFQQGGGVGKALGEYFVAEGVEAPEIGVISCERYGACQERIAGFTEELLKLVPGAVIVDNQEALEVDLAVEVATNMLTAHPTLDAFYGEAGNMVAGAAVAIELAGRDDVVVFGHDISPTTAELLLDGSIVKYINAMLAEDFGMTALDLAISAVMGEPSPGVIYNMTPMDFFSSNPEEVEAWLAAHSE